MEKTGGANQKLILAAMILAVSMTFIDQTIVAIAIPQLQGDLSLSSTGVQWIINGYLLSLSALFAFGGRLADIAGHRHMVVIGVGLVLSPANTDALNRVPSSRYGEATGITQTVRNFGSSLGLAVLSTILILENKANLGRPWGAGGAEGAGGPDRRHDRRSGWRWRSRPCRAAGAHAKTIYAAIPHDFALASRTVFYAMAGVMAVAFLVALKWMPSGKAPDLDEPEVELSESA